MATHSVRTSRPLREVLSIIHGAVRSLAEGRGRYGQSFRRLFFATFADTWFFNVNQAFMAKARGGADNLGERWPPLSPSTIAARPVTNADLVSYQIHAKHRRGLLSPAEDKMWRRIFRHKVRALMALGMHEESEAKPRAAAAAWAILKARGAKTRKDTLSERRVLTLIRTWKLESSLRSGGASGATYHRYNSNQIYRVSGGKWTGGTRVPYAKFHQRGTKWMPARPVIPPAKVQRPWIIEASTDGLDQVTERVVSILA